MQRLEEGRKPVATLLGGHLVLRSVRGESLSWRLDCSDRFEVAAFSSPEAALWFRWGRTPTSDGAVWEGEAAAVSADMGCSEYCQTPMVVPLGREMVAVGPGAVNGAGSELAAGPVGAPADGGGGRRSRSGSRRGRGWVPLALLPPLSIEQKSLDRQRMLHDM